MKIYKHRLFFLILGYLVSIPGADIFGANDNYPLGSRSAGMRNATVMLPDFWSVSHNQAGLGWIRNIGIGFHHENKFIVPEYGLQSLAVVIPTKPGTLGFNYSYFGYSKYHESKVGLSFGRAFGNSVAAGIQMNYMSTFITEEYGSQGNLTVEGGIIAKPFDFLYIGAHVFNPTRTKISSYDEEPVPTIFRVGLGVQLLEKVFIGLETEKELDHKPINKAGIEFEPLTNLFLRAGISTNPTQTSFGMGYEFKGFRADIAFTVHQQLGLTPHFTLMYSFN
ncbi:MAG: hypothetical protein JSV24_11330 [Bacteroidales bacterium]|nr:MAG: hypothetical protein JSV24_11330 [Bacteroidales bacterium]